MIDHYVVWLYISMGDTFRMAVIEGLEDLVHIVSDIEVSEALVESSEVNVTSVHILHDKSGCLSHRISHYIYQIDDVCAALQSLEDLDFSSDLGLFNYTYYYTANTYLA